MSKISVVIPSYNGALLVGKAIESIFAQSMQDYDIIVVDDGSTDNTREALKPYLENPKCKYLYKENGGPSAARNFGAQASSAEYLFFLDADDTLVPSTLESVTSALDKTGAAWCLIDNERIDGETSKVVQTKIPAEDPFYGILRKDFVRHSNIFRRTDFHDVGMYDEGLWYREDWDVYIRMFHMRKPFVYLGEPLYVYVSRQGSMTKGSRKQIFHAMSDTEKVLRKHHKRLADAGDRQAAKIYAENMWELGRHYLYGTRSYKLALGCMRESLGYDLNLSRLVHPFTFHIERLLNRRVKDV